MGFRHAIAIAGLAGALASTASRAEPPQPAADVPAIISGAPRSGDRETPGADRARQHRAGRRTSHLGHRHLAARHGAHHGSGGEPLERPALAGVELVAPIPHPIQPPHATVPVPAYPFENFVTFYTTPPPPVFCHRVPRDPDAPDPHLIRERPVLCEADNP